MSLPRETRFAIRMLIETLAGAQDPKLHAFMKDLEKKTRAEHELERSQSD